MLKRFGQLTLAFAFLAAAAFGQGVRFDSVGLLDTGRPANGATVRVCQAGSTGGTGCTPLASIYTNQALTVAKSNPFTSDARGNYNFYVAPGTYDIVLSGPGITTATFPNQQIGPSGNFIQNANGADFINVRRFTDTSPTGNFLRFTNAAGNADLWTVDVTGTLQAGIIPAARISSGTFSSAQIPWATPGAIGSTTPNTGAFTLLTVPALNNGVDLAVPSTGSNLVSDTATQTLTNKTLTSPTVTNPRTTGTDSGSETLQNKDLVVASSGNNVTLVNQQGASGAITGNSTAQNLFSFSLPGNTVQAGKGIRIKAVTLHNTGTAGPTYALKIGATTVESFVLAPNNNTQVDYFEWDIYNNAGVQNAQTWARKSVQNQTGLVNAAIGGSAGTAAVDLSSTQTITWSFNVANTDAVTPKFWSIELIQ